MLEIRRHANLAQEALGAEHGTEFRVEYLECDVSRVLEVAGEIDRRHATASNLTLDLVPIGQPRGEQRGDSRQRGANV